MTPVLTKRDMYARLTAGEFGNTSHAWTDWTNWWMDTIKMEGHEKTQWGVRSHTANDPRTKLNVLHGDVAAHLRSTGLDRDGFNISRMLWQVGHVQWEGDVYDHPTEGVVACGNLDPVPGSWRTHMKKPREWGGTRARALLRTVLNDNSFDDIMTLLENYRGHVVEFTAYDVCIGTCPGRNAVVWEVRRY